MIDINLKYQASIFVNATDIKPEPDTIKLLIDVFKDKSLIPGTFQELRPPNPVQTRLQFSSQNNEWAVMFASHRIDIEKNPTDSKGSNLGDLSEFCSDATSLFERLITTYKKRANRLALITNFFLDEMSEERFREIYRKLFTPPRFYIDNSPFEWNWRSVSKIPANLQELDESFHVITSINRVRGHLGKGLDMTPFNRLQLSYDINVSPDNPENRFEFPHILTFYNSATELHSNLCEQLFEYING